MKRIFTLLCIIHLFNCSNDNNDDSNDFNTAEFGLEAKIDGELFSLETDDLIIESYQNGGNAGGGNRIYGCLTETNECISLSTFGETFDPNGFQEGQVLDFNLFYSIGNQTFYNYNFNLNNTHQTNTADIPLGQFTITERTENYAEGTFSFVAYNYNNDISINITEGVFKVSLEEE